MSRIEPYDGAPEGTLPTFRVQFSEACGSVVEVVKTGQIDLPASVTTGSSDRDRSRRERSRRDRDRDRGRRRRDDDDEPRDRRGYDADRRRRSDRDRSRRDRSRSRDDGDRDRDRSRRDRSRERSRRDRSRDRSRRDRSRSRDRSRRDEPRRDAAPIKQEGESLLAGRDIMGDVIAAERAEATVDHKGDCYRRPIGFNTALIVASDKYTYKARARSRSPDRVKEVVHVAPVVPSRRDD